mmetsp:Transcript_5661/g.17164  ORF Transcript_5661/g.17164 Transcript_5661/m.17164 type:complete len:353 (-) Transcript_5661:511-1569(-)
MYVFPQPGPEALEVPLGNLSPEVWDALLRVLEELARVHGAQGVRREVAESQAAPVDVLQDALLVARDVDPEVLLVELPPLVWKVVDGDRPVEEPLLELEPDDDVERIRELIGVHADQALLDLVDGLVEILRLQVLRELKAFRDHRAEEGPELHGLPDHPLEEQGHALVDAHAEGLGHWHPEVLPSGPVLLVERVARLVDEPGDSGYEVLVVVARGDPDIARGAARERVKGTVQDPLEPQTLHDLSAEGLLLVHLKDWRGVASGQPRVDGELGSAGDLLDQRDQASLHGLEDFGEPRGFHSALELIDLVVVRELLRRHGLRLVDPELDDLRQDWLEAVVVVVLARLRPRLIAL